MAISNFVKRIQDVMRRDAGVNGDAQRIEQLAWMLFLKVYDAKEQEWEAAQEGYHSVIPEVCRWHNWAGKGGSGKAGAACFATARSETGLTGEELLDFVNHTLLPTLKNLGANAAGSNISGASISKTDSSGANIPGAGVPETMEAAARKRAMVQAVFEDVNNYMKDGVLLRQVIDLIEELELAGEADHHTLGQIYEEFLRDLQGAGNAGEFYTPRAVTDFMAEMVKPQPGERIADFACGTGGFLVSALERRSGGSRHDKIYGMEKKALPHILCVTNMLLHGIEEPGIFRGNALETDYKQQEELERFDVILLNPPYGGKEKKEILENFPAKLRSADTAELFLNVILFRLEKNGRCGVIMPDGFLFGTDIARKNRKKKLLEEFNLHTVIRLPRGVFAPYTSIASNILFFDRTHPTRETWFYRMDLPEGYKSFSKTKPVKAEHFAQVQSWWTDRRELTENSGDKARKYTAEELVKRNYDLDLCGYPHKEEAVLPPKELILEYRRERARQNQEMEEILSQITALLGIDLTEEEQ